MYPKFQNSLDSLEDHVASLMTGPNRFYHTFTHVQNTLNMYRMVFGTIPLADYLAILYHDVVYDATRNDNEEKSVEQFKVDLGNIVIADEVIESILGTKHGSGNKINARVNDMDLSILAAPKNVYVQYVNDVRKEYSHLSDEQWKVGRKKFVDQMIKQRIFQTAEAFSMLELAALTNLSNELKTL